MGLADCHISNPWRYKSVANSAVQLTGRQTSLMEVETVMSTSVLPPHRCASTSQHLVSGCCPPMGRHIFHVRDTGPREDLLSLRTRPTGMSQWVPVIQSSSF